MTEESDLLQLVESTLSLLMPYQSSINAREQASDPLDSLLSQCRQEVARIEASGSPPLRIIHHFACTGGTLISRAMACQPNTMVLSELDPFSTWSRPRSNFAPSDLIFQARQDRSPPSNMVIGEMFEAMLQRLYIAMTAQGRDLILRDHTHSHFCTEVDPTSRPSMGALLRRTFDLRQLITVRHPLDSFISLHQMNSAKGPVYELGGYCLRYLAFLNTYPEVEICYYEHFSERPDEECRAITNLLEIDFTPRWQDVLPVIQLSGDSGRKATQIGPRPRRPVPEMIRDNILQGCPEYESLCQRLGYAPDPEAPPLPIC